MKRRIFSAILTASMLLTQSVLVFGAEATETTTSVSIPYTQDFEDAALKVYNYTDAATGTVTTATNYYEQKTDDADEAEKKNYYGRFQASETAKGERIGVPVDEKGITEGKLKISFRFRPIGIETDYANVVSFVCLGHETGTQTKYLTLLAINPKHTDATKNRALGVLRSNGWQVPMNDANNSAAHLNEGDKDKWFTYNAEVDLDTRSVNVKVVNEETKAEYTYAESGIALTTGNNNNTWDRWPNVTNMKQFVVTGPIDIDDLSITGDLRAEELSFVAANGAESSNCSTFAPTAKVTFNEAVKTVNEGAITIDGVDCSGGALSEDGTTYTFDVPDSLVAGTKHKVNVDPSKLEPVIESVFAGNSSEFEFTYIGAALYTQDFNDSTLNVYDYTNAAIGTVTTDIGKYEQKTDDADEVENKNYYGRFITGKTYGGRRIGVSVDEKGITEGKLKVSFRFRPIGLEQDYANVVSYVGLGHETGAQTNYLTLLAINPKHTDATKNRALGVLRSNGWQVPMNDANNSAAHLNEGDKDKWFTYTAEVDLDTRSVDVKVVNEETKAEYTYEKTGIALTTGSGNNIWDNWPKTTDMTRFVVTGPMDIDDISMTYVLEAEELSFVTANGADNSECSIFTPTAKVTFSEAVKAVPEGAVTMDGVDCSGGTLSTDGKVYTFDLPDTLISGTTHEVAVDTSKLEPVIDGVLAGNSEEFEFTVTNDDVKTALYTQDFEDETLTANNYTNSNTSKPANANEFKIATDDGDDVTDKNYYGSFHSGDNGNWTRVGLNIGTPGPKEGILKVNFRFRPVEVGTRVAFVALGYDTAEKKNHRLAVLGVSKNGDMGVMESNGISNPMTAADGTNAVLTSADASNWFEYSAVLNLDTRSLDVEVMRENDGTKYTYRKDNINVRSTAGDNWGNWPQITELRNFMVMGAMDVDDLSVTYDINPVIIADEASVEASVIAATAGDNSLIIAQYNGSGDLVGVTVSDVVLAEGQSALLKAEAAWKNDAKTAMAFIWDNLNKVTPLGTAKLANKPAAATEGE